MTFTIQNNSCVFSNKTRRTVGTGLNTYRIVHGIEHGPLVHANALATNSLRETVPREAGDLSLNCRAALLGGLTLTSGEQGRSGKRFPSTPCEIDAKYPHPFS